MINKKFCEVICDFCEQKKEKDSAIAKELGVDRKVLVKWKKGLAYPRIDTLILLGETMDRKSYKSVIDALLPCYEWELEYILAEKTKIEEELKEKEKNATEKSILITKLENEIETMKKQIKNLYVELDAGNLKIAERDVRLMEKMQVIDKQQKDISYMKSEMITLNNELKAQMSEKNNLIYEANNEKEKYKKQNNKLNSIALFTVSLFAVVIVVGCTFVPTFNTKIIYFCLSGFVALSLALIYNCFFEKMSKKVNVCFCVLSLVGLAIYPIYVSKIMLILSLGVLFCPQIIFAAEMRSVFDFDYDNLNPKFINKRNKLKTCVNTIRKIYNGLYCFMCLGVISIVIMSIIYYSLTGSFLILTINSPL